MDAAAALQSTLSPCCLSGAAPRGTAPCRTQIRAGAAQGCASPAERPAPILQGALHQWQSRGKERSAQPRSLAASCAVLPHSSRLSPLQADELSSPFGQISLSRQGSTEAPDPSMFQPSLISQHPQQAGFIMATPGQPIPTSNYSASGHTVPTQQVLQPQGYIQPPQQVRNRKAGGDEELNPDVQGRGLLGRTVCCWGGAALLFLLLICDGATDRSQSAVHTCALRRCVCLLVRFLLPRHRAELWGALGRSWLIVEVGQ